MISRMHNYADLRHYGATRGRLTHSILYWHNVLIYRNTSILFTPLPIVTAKYLV